MSPGVEVQWLPGIQVARFIWIQFMHQQISLTSFCTSPTMWDLLLWSALQSLFLRLHLTQKQEQEKTLTRSQIIKTPPPTILPLRILSTSVIPKQIRKTGLTWRGIHFNRTDASSTCREHSIINPMDSQAAQLRIYWHSGRVLSGQELCFRGTKGGQQGRLCRV